MTEHPNLKLLSNDNIKKTTSYHIIFLDEPYNYDYESSDWIDWDLVEEKEILYSDMTIFESIFNHILRDFEHYDCYEITDFYGENSTKLINLLNKEKDYIKGLSRNKFEEKYEWIFDLVRSSDFTLEYEKSKEFELIFNDINEFIDIVIKYLNKSLIENKSVTIVGI